MKYFDNMKGLSLILLSSCIESNLPCYKFPIDESKIESGYLILEKHKVELNSREIHLFITNTKSSKCKGFVKGITTKRIELITTSKDTIRFRFLENSFKDNFNGDKAYEIKDTLYIKELINRAEIRGLVNHQKGIINLTKIFEDYKTNEESIESEENKYLVSKSLKELNPKKLTEKEIILLIDYWIYYDPTDFGVKDKIKPIFLEIEKDLKSACLKRKIEKHKWEYKNEYFNKSINELETLK